MVPAFVVPLAVMPLNANGKTDRAALPAPVAGGRGVLAAPRDKVEERLCAIWCDTLEVANVGIDDNFLELGGHSLLAARIVARAASALGVDLPVRALFDNPTVRQFAASCRTSAAVDTTRVQRHAGGAAHLSFSQRRLWFLDQMVTDPSVYSVQSVWRLTGPLDTEALRQSLDEVWRRHDVLRARFENDDGEPRLVLSSAPSFPLREIDLSGWPPSEAEQRARDAARLDADLRFDLENGPLARAQLMALGDQRHFLLLSFHHIVVDGWSLNVLWREVSELYGARVAGSPASLTPLAVQYHDYAAWQHEWLAGPDAAEQTAFWQEQLRGSTTLELPTDHPRPKMLSGQGGQVDFTVPRSTYEALGQLGRDNRASLFMVLLTAFDVLLSRYTASTDIITGAPISGRVRPELDDLIGFFVNTIPLRLRWSGDPDFTELLAATREVSLDAYAREGVPFDTIVTRLAADRDPSRNPIFQIWFDVDSTPEPVHLGGLQSELVEEKIRNARFDLEMLLTERNGDLSGKLVHSTDLFTTVTARRIVQHFLRLLEAVAADPHRPISGLPMLGPREREALIAMGRRDAQGVPSIEDPIVALACQVARTPDRVALSGKTPLTYADLDTRANQVAHKLREEGIGPEDMVGVCMERGTDVFLVMLAVMKAGAVYLPLDPVHPAGRLAHMARSAAASLVLCDASLRQDFPPGQYRVRDASAFLADARTGRYPVTAPRRGVRPGNASYAVFTSGSTGQPKGIALCDATIGNVVAWKLAEGHGPRVCAQLSSIGFDVSLQEFFETLCTGGTLTIVDDEQRADLDRLIDVLSQERVECVYCSPAMLQQLASTWTERTDRPQLALREIIVGGEPLRITPELRELLGSLGGATVENQYGPSETHKATRLLLTGDEGDWPAAPSIGTPIANVSVYLLDPFLCPVPPGVRGEVYIASPGTARGYLGRSALTSEGFVADPFAPSAGSRMYRTGDVARWDATGQLEFAGRNDDQVKIRGYRVEPAEVATAIGAHPRVLDSTVFAQTGTDGLPYLAAYTVHAVDAAPVTARELRDFLSDRLPDYMIPAAFVPVPELPLNRNGKVDRARLPDPLGARVMASEKRVLPRNPQERLIAAIWSEVLSIGEPGIDDNFFDVGGHSLLATRVMSRVRKTFALTLSVRELFENPTIRRLAQAVEVAIVRDVTASSLPSAPHDQPHEDAASPRPSPSAHWLGETVERPAVHAHHLVEAQAAVRPDSLAVIDPERGSVTYAELNARADAFAELLRDRGAHPGALIGICLDKGLDLAVAVLAVLKAGAAFLPLDPAYPDERMAFVLDDARPALVVSTRAGTPAAVPSKSLLLLDEMSGNGPILHHPQPRRSPSGPSADAAAYLIYTSGSTGLPKAAVVTHGNLVNFTLSATDRFGLTESDRFLQLAPFAFDVFLEETFPTWHAGGAVVFPPRDFDFEPASLIRIISDSGVTVCELTTAYWNTLMLDHEEHLASLPAHFRLLLIGGDRPAADAVRRWEKSGVALGNVYGLTETSVTSTSNIERWDAGPGQRGELPIGSPWPNTQVHLLDDHLRAVAPGETGELYIGGAGVSRGYLNRPALTAVRFVADPFSSRHGALLYRTGDLATVREGRLELLGRADHQLKVRGFRVEPGEIETVLEAHPAVAQAVVVGHEDSPGNQRLTGYVVLAAAVAYDAVLPDIFRHLRSRLPRHLVPATLIPLAELPRTANGKLDRQALPSRGSGRHRTATTRDNEGKQS
jgi:amino acid adenylation domain-containing protein